MSDVLNSQPFTVEHELQRRIAAAVGAVAAGAALVIVLFTAGCSDAGSKKLAVHPVTGLVTFDGKPAGGAWITFHPKGGDGSLPRPRAQADPHGNYSVMTYEPQDGAPQGEYVVTLELHKTIHVGGELESGPNLLPAKYSVAATSNVVVTVAEGPNRLPINIKR